MYEKHDPPPVQNSKVLHIYTMNYSLSSGKYCTKFGSYQADGL